MQESAPCKMLAMASVKPKLFALKGNLKKLLLVMKITAILLLVVALQVSAKGWGQEKINLSLTDAPLEQIFQSIKTQANVVFFYRPQYVKDKKATINVANASLKTVLDICMKNQQLTYEIVGKTVAIRLAKNDHSGANIEAIENTPPLIDVRGRVVNEKGEPVEGVTVAVRGSSKSTATDKNGEFSLATIEQDATLVFTHISMESFEIKVSGKTDLTINLRTKVSALGDVQVTVNTGYQNITKERFVGSAVKLDSISYARQAGVNIIDRLDGKVTGVLFNRKGGGVPLQIRGISTLGLRSGGSLNPFNPLIIIDNFPYDGDLNNINQNDVQDITILKDAAAASIWGARAGNGVIVITTKSGKYNKPFQINFSSNVTIQEKPDLFYFPQMTSSDFIDVEQFLFSKNFYNRAITLPKFFVISPVEQILDKQRKGLISATEANDQIDALRELDVRNDYNKYVYQKAVSQQQYMSMNGGNNSFSYLFSVGYNKSTSNIQHSKPGEQITINSVNTFRPLKNLELELGINFSKSKTNSSNFNYPLTTGGARGGLYPYAQLADENGSHLTTPKDYGNAFIDTAGGGRLLDWKYRPLDELELTDNITTAQFARINLGASYKVTNWLKADIRYQFLSQTDENRNLRNLQSYYTRNLINLYTNLNQTAPNLVNPIPIGGILDITNGKANSSNLRGSLNFNKSWKGGHEITSFIAGDVSESRGSTNSNRFYGYNDAILSYVPAIDYTTTFPFFAGINSGTIPQGTALAEGAHNRFVSLSGNISYSYNNRYTAYISGRRDGANVFGVNTNRKWKPLMSAGLSWDVSKELFYKVAWMPYLRLRASFGYMGNVDNTRTGMPVIGYTGTLPYTNLPGAAIGSAPNPDLRWEQVRTINVGIDFSVLKSRLAGSIEWYQKRSTDLISNIPFDATTGVDAFAVNAANLKGNGVDIQLNSKNLVNAFRWESVFGLSYSKTIVTKYYNVSGDYNISNYLGYGINPLEGKQAWAIYSYRWNGLDAATGDPQGYFDKKVSNDYVSIINDSIQNQVFHGSALPLVSGFLMNTFSWKQLSLSANITYKMAYYFRKNSINYFNLFNSWESHSDYVNRWQKPGDESYTNVPSLVYPANSRRDMFYNNAEVNVLKGDHIRLQDIRLTYTWSNYRYKRFPIRNAQLFLYVNNLNVMLWRANKSGLDPDYASTVIPPARTWTFGLNVSL